MENHWKETLYVYIFLNESAKIIEPNMVSLNLKESVNVLVSTTLSLSSPEVNDIGIKQMKST